MFFYWGGGGGAGCAGASERRGISKILQNWEGQNGFVRRCGRVTLLSEGIKYSMLLLLESTLSSMLRHIPSLWKTKTCMFEQSY